MTPYKGVALVILRFYYYFLTLMKIQEIIEFFEHYCDKVRHSFAQLKFDNYDIVLDDSKVKLFYTELTKFRNSNSELFLQTEKFFKKLEEPLHPGTQYSDDEKLCFCLNFFNFKLLHQLLFKESSFPKEYCHWRQLVDKTKFILFGYQEMPLFWLDQAVIRQV